MYGYWFAFAGSVLLSALCASVPAAAGDCWVPGVDAGEKIRAAENGGLRAKVLKAEQVLMGDRAANAIGDVRYQVHRSIDWEPRHAGAPLPGIAQAYLHKPEAWTGKCGLRGYADDIHFAALSIGFNTLGEVVDLAPTRFDDWDAFLEPEVTARREGYPIYGNRVLVITPPGIPPVVPVTVGEYLDYWERKLTADAQTMAGDATPDAQWQAYIKQLEKSDPKQATELRQTMIDGAAVLSQGQDHVASQLASLRKRRASLTPAERKAPVYLTSEAVDAGPFGYAKESDPGAQRVVRINPALWRGKRNDQQVRSVALVVNLSRLDTFDNHDPDAQIDQVLQWLHRADLAPYRQLLDQ